MLVLQIVAGRIIYEVLMTLFSMTSVYWKVVNKITCAKMKAVRLRPDEDDPEYTVPD